MKYVLSGLIVFCNYLLFAQSYQESTEIIRDKWGVPHIYAPTDRGVSFGLAWAHAEDDFETIQLPLLSAKGMLGQHLGMKGATVDYVAGLLRLSDIVDENYGSLSEEYLVMLQGYVDGINLYAETHPNEVLVKHSFPVTKKDVLKAYVLSLSVLSKADKVIGKLFANDTVFTRREGSEPSSRGSNAIAISSQITETGETFLAVNSHQPYEGPQAWYEAHLVSEEGWNALGGLFPGGATIFHGVNPYLGWAHTVNFPDLVDVFKLEVDKNKKGFYIVDGKSLELESRKIVLRAKTFLGFNLRIKKKAYWSEYGPVIKNKHGYYAFDLGALHDIRAAQQWYEMNKASSWEEFYIAISKVSIPCFNIVYADREGNIFHVGNGKIPVRNSRFNWDGVVPGNTSLTKNTRYYPFDSLPQNFNPKSGYVFNMNNSPFTSSGEGFNPKKEDHHELMGFDSWENNRSIRFLQLMDDKEQVSFDEFLEIKYDIQLPDSLVFPIDINGLDEIPPGMLQQEERDLLNIMLSWDRKATIQSIGSAHYIVFYEFLNQKFKTPYKSYFRPTNSDLVEALENTRQYFMKNYNTLDVKLGEFQVLKRGDKTLPLQGVNDVIAAIKSEEFEKGKWRGVQGESYILLARFKEDALPILESVNVYGASNNLESVHFDDQMELFIDQKRKKMTLDIDQVRKEAKAIYKPYNLLK